MNSVGDYIGKRLVNFGVEYAFGVVGDTSAALLDSLGHLDPSIKLITCCSDASAGYAADGYTRKSGKLGVVVVPYLTGSLSITNAIAGAYANGLPMLIICGGPNSSAVGNNMIMHQTINNNGFGTVTSSQCLSPITAKVFVVHHAEDVAFNVDKAIYTALKLRKPVYLEIACDLVSKFIAEPVPINLATYGNLHCDELSLEVALCSCTRAIQHSNVPMVVLGSEIKSLGLVTLRLLEHFIETLQAAVVVQPDAKGCFDETSPLFAGTLWGSLSSRHVQQVISQADLLIRVGVVLSDASTVGFSSPLLTDHEHLMCLHANSLSIKGHIDPAPKKFAYVALDRLLTGLAERVPRREASQLLASKLSRESAMQRIPSPSLSSGSEPVDPSLLFPSKPAKPAILQSNTALSQACGSVCAALPPLLQASPVSLHLSDVQAGIQHLLDMNSAVGPTAGTTEASMCVSSVVVAEGESWFLGQKLLLNKGCDYFSQLQFTCNDWPLGATIGISLAAGGRHKWVVLVIGDGSFQSALQELSTMIRLKLKVVVLILNNQKEAIEGSQHSFTGVTNWNYADIVSAMQNGGKIKNGAVTGGEKGQFSSSSCEKESKNKSMDKSMGKSVGMRVSTPSELTAAIKALDPCHSVYLIECAVAAGEISSECSTYSQQMAASNRKDFAA